MSGAYTSLGTYSYEEFGAIVGAMARAAGLTPTDTLRLVGRRGFGPLASRAPHVLDGLEDWRSVLRSLDGIIHPEVKKIYADAEVPSFSALDEGDGMLVTYRSPRRLCALADGLMRGAGEWFGTELNVVHETCVAAGAESCTMRVSEVGRPEAVAPPAT